MVEVLNVLGDFPFDTLLGIAEKLQCTPLQVMNFLFGLAVNLGLAVGILLAFCVFILVDQGFRFFRWLRSRKSTQTENEKKDR